MSREHTPTPSEDGSSRYDEETDPVDPVNEQVTDTKPARKPSMTPFANSSGERRRPSKNSSSSCKTSKRNQRNRSTTSQMEDLFDRALAEIKVYRVAADEAAKLNIPEAAGKVKGWRAFVTNKDQKVHPCYAWIAKRKALHQTCLRPRTRPAGLDRLHGSSKKIQSRARSHRRRTVCG